MAKPIRSTQAMLLAAAMLLTSPAAVSAITVRSTADAGGTCPGADCTLRQAIATAAAGETIDFSLPPNSVITLTTGVLAIQRQLTISGPGAKLLAVQRSSAPGTAAFANFAILGVFPVTIAGLTISNGAGFIGGGVVNFDGIVTISGCTISGNSASDSGGGISNHAPVGSRMTIIDSTITGNRADIGGTARGGGVFSEGPLTIVNTTISGNAAFSGGGLYTNSGAVGVTSLTITGNSSNSSGGGVFRAGGTVTMRNTIVARNTVPAGGGTGPDLSGTFSSGGWNLIGNASNSSGFANGVNADQVGGFANPAVDPRLGPLQDNGGATFTHALLAGSPAIDKGFSGTVYDQRGFVRPADTPDIVNAAGGDGSDIGAYEVTPSQLTGCNTVVTNNNDSGTGSLRAVIAAACPGSIITFGANVTGPINLVSGELALNKSLSIVGPGANLLRIQRSGASAFRIFNVSPANISARISGLTISNGSAFGPRGGGIRNNATLTIADAVISDNVADNGGGIYNDFGQLTIRNSTITGNSVSDAIISGSGGGIFNHGGVVTIDRSTISGNTALGPGGNSDSGGGIITNVGSVMLFSSTITANSGDLGGGIRNVNGGTVRAKNTIIALNTSPSGPDMNGPLISDGFNIIGIGTAPAAIVTIKPSDQIGRTAAQVNLGSLQNNGGRTPTHALLAGSLAVDAGNSAGTFADQRGWLRPIDAAGVATAVGGDGSDIGAFEFSSATLDIDGNGNYDALTDGLLLIRYLFGLTGNSLIIGAIGPLATRTTATAIVQFLDGVRPTLDIDGNLQPDALTDGLAALRYLFGLRGAALTVNAVGPAATRGEAQIETYLQSLVP